MYRSEKLIYNSCFYCLQRLRPDSLVVFRTGNLLRSYSRTCSTKTTSSDVFGTRGVRLQCILSNRGNLLFSFEQTRALVTSQCLLEDSKVEQQLEILKEKEKSAKKTDKDKTSGETHQTLPQNVGLAKVEDGFASRAWIKVKKEVKHYYNGFRLFSLETMISVRLLRKIANGDALTRRERKQLLRTVADIFRLVPFLIFIIIPFMEFLLPFALKLFPGMLPSTFEEKASKDMKAKQRFKLKLEMAKFLQDTVEQMAVKRGSSTSETAQKFSEFMSKVREGDLAVSNEEILKFSKAFRDSLMMDNLERQQLMALCKILNIPTIGNTNIMRFQIKLRMRRIKAEDLQIQQEENISKLETADLQSLVRERGMRAYGVSKQRLITQLEEWVDLHLNDKVPLSLLLLSRTLYIPPSETGADPTTTEQLKATISSLPSETSETVKLRLEELESGQIDNQARLAKVKREQEAIAKEAAEKEESIKQAQELAIKTKQEETERILDTALHDFPPGYTSADQPVIPEAPSAPELTPNVIKAVEEVLTDLAESKSHVSEERDDFNELVQEIQDYNASLKETLEAASEEDKVKVRRGSKLLSRYLQYSVKRMRPVVDRIEADRKEAKDTIKQLSQDKKEALDEQTVKMIDSKIETHEGTVATIDEVRSAMKTLSQVSDDEIMSEIVKIIDPDKDGIVEVDTVVKAIEFMSSYAGENNSPEALKDLIEVLEKEVKMKKRISSALSSVSDKEKISAQL